MNHGTNGQPATNTSGTNAFSGGPAVRVILVGRTGLDAALRADERTELVRAKTALDAVGELTDPLDDNSSGRSVVVVAPDADPARIGGETGRQHGAGFVAALKRVDSGVRVLRLVRAGEDEQPGVYDGVIRADAEPARLREAITDAHSTRFAPPSGSPTSAAGPVPSARSRGMEAKPLPEAPASMPTSNVWAEPVRTGETAGSGRVGDETLAKLLLRGRDVVWPAMELVRSRLGRADVVFVPGEPEAAAPVNGCVVAWRGRVMGVLRAPGGGVSDEVLAEHAEWLAGWMALAEQHAQLRDAAFKDPLTDAWNRRYFERFLGTAIDEARRHRRNLTVMVFDIDDFKTYNDRFGHGAGDEILKEAVRLLRSVTRPSDRVCRIGGDEFAVIFHEPQGPRDPSSRHPESVFQIAQRFQRQVVAQRFPKLGLDAPGTLTISGGLATFPWDGHDAESLLARADELALQSKRQGKNAITLGPGAMRVCGQEGAEKPPTPYDRA